ncbi:unnamed protein product [Ectocarpus sp. 6 AP-2014]
MVAMMTIKGFPSSLPEAEIKGLLETIGQVDIFRCNVDGDSLTCTCRYSTDDDTAKAKKGFHDLEMGEMTLKVDVEEAAPGTTDTSSAGNAGGDGSGDKAPAEGSSVDEKKPAASEEPPRRKKSRFAPPPTGAVDLQAGLGATPGAAGSGLLGIPGLGGGGLGLVGLPPASVHAAGAGGLGGLGLPGKCCMRTIESAMGGLGGMPAAMTPQMKSQIEIFVGNIPVGTTQQGLVDFLNAAMLKVGLNLQPGNPVTSCRLNSKFAFCVMRNPEEAAKALNLNGIPYLGNVLKMQRPSSYTGPPDRAVTWQVLTGQAEMPAEGMMLMQNSATKLSCEVFVGNIPPETQAPTLQEYLGGALVQVGLCKPPNPILSIRMNARFAFLEMRTAEEATAALNLDGIPFGGAALSVGRPKKYEGPVTPHKTWFDVLAECSFGLMGGAGQGGAAEAEPAPTSTVVRIGNVVTPEELTDDEAQKEVVEDMTEECSKYGAVAGIEIPHVGGAGAGVGFVFVKFHTLEDAQKAKKGFGSRTFDGKSVDATYFPEEQFAAKSFAS